MDSAALEGGFSTPSTQAARAFRQIMEAMARPGTITQVTGAAPPAPLSAAAGAVVLTLCDPDTPLHLAGACDTQDVRAWVAFHTGASIVGKASCSFALGEWEALAPLTDYAQGTPAYPDRSATLIVERQALDSTGTSVTGPGIRDRAALNLPDPQAFRANHAQFPLGVDAILTCGDRLAALPRSTEVL